MGGSQSTRTITVDDNSLIVTEDVQKRLLGQESANKGQVMSQEDVDSVRRQIEQEYVQRMKVISSSNQRILAEQFARAVQEVEAKFIKQTGSPVCHDLQQEVYNCYQEHYKQPLRCSAQVKAFTQAVERERRNAFVTSKQS